MSGILHFRCASLLSFAADEYHHLYRLGIADPCRSLLDRLFREAPRVLFLAHVFHVHSLLVWDYSGRDDSDWD